MKFSFTHKINLANIDRDLYPYETEDISVSDADSFDEARQTVDRIVAERVGYYKALSQTAKEKNNPQATLPFFPPATPQTTIPADSTFQPYQGPTISQDRIMPAGTGVPEEFQI